MRGKKRAREHLAKDGKDAEDDVIDLTSDTEEDAAAAAAVSPGAPASPLVSTPVPLITGVIFEIHLKKKCAQCLRGNQNFEFTNLLRVAQHASIVCKATKQGVFCPGHSNIVRHMYDVFYERSHDVMVEARIQ